RGRVVNLEEEGEHVAIARARGIEDDLDGLRVPGVVAIGGVVVLAPRVADARADNARLFANEVFHPPEASARQDGGFSSGRAGDGAGVLCSTGHENSLSLLQHRAGMWPQWVQRQGVAADSPDAFRASQGFRNISVVIVVDGAAKRDVMRRKLLLWVLSFVVVVVVGVSAMFAILA